MRSYELTSVKLIEKKTIDFSGAILRHEDGSHDADGNADDDGSRGYINTSHDHGQNSENVVSRFPAGTQKKFKNADLLNRRNTVCKKEEADQCNCQNRGAGCDEKDRMHEFFFYHSYSLRS